MGPNVQAMEVITKASDQMGKNFKEFSSLASLLKKSLWANLVSADLEIEVPEPSPVVPYSLRFLKNSSIS
jgi:hypothetical protein